jgi:dipeptidyl-peptidase III
MIENQIKSYTTGSIEDHKNSQRDWIKDKIPEVEANMGWTEKYLDPTNLRATWEGFVAIVNKKRTKNLTKLVHKGEKILKFMPWEHNIEKKAFLAPDFTSLDMLEWHGAG